MDPFNLAVSTLGALVLGLGLASARLARTAAPPTLLALVLGVAIGPVGLGLIDPLEQGHFLSFERATRLVLAVGLVSVALRIPKAYPREHWRTAAVLLGLGMPLMWGTSTLVVKVALGLDWTMAALVGAIVTATDPVAATPIVTGKVAEDHLPGRIRHAISFESGANDGLGYLIVMLPLLLLTRPEDEALGHWLRETMLWEVGAATTLGLALGWAAGRLLRVSEEREWIEDDWKLVYTVALSFLAVGAGRLVESDELLVVFAAGAAFVQAVGDRDRSAEERGQEAVNRFFAVPFFTLLGTALPWAGWAALGWSGVALAAGVLLFRRPPVLLALKPLLPDVRTWREAAFVGWFGPIAVAAVYYAALVAHRLDDTVVWDAVTLVVAASVVVHGATAVPVTKRVQKDD